MLLTIGTQVLYDVRSILQRLIFLTADDFKPLTASIGQRIFVSPVAPPCRSISHILSIAALTHFRRYHLRCVTYTPERRARYRFLRPSIVRLPHPCDPRVANDTSLDADIVCARAKNHYDPQGNMHLSDSATQLSAGQADASVVAFRQAFRPLHNAQRTLMYFSVCIFHLMVHTQRDLTMIPNSNGNLDASLRDQLRNRFDLAMLSPLFVFSL